MVDDTLGYADRLDAVKKGYECIGKREDGAKAPPTRSVLNSDGDAGSLLLPKNPQDLSELTCQKRHDMPQKFRKEGHTLRLLACKYRNGRIKIYCFTME